jgi:hypothetical protein
LDTEHPDVQPGPVKVTDTPPGSKPDPVMVNVKDWPSTGGLGEVAIPLIAGFDTTRLTPAEGVPLDPF